MIKTIEKPGTTEIRVCDLCTSESDQDDILREFEIPIIGKVDMHSRCYGIIKSRMKKTLGLKTKV